MIVREVRLENVKSYGSPAEVIRLTTGVNAICGANGAGKSTVLEAIGSVLFQHLPYRQEDFVREGQSSGTIVVVVESRLDGRTYEVVRRVGKPSSQQVFDPDISQTVARGEAEVRSWLHTHLRLDAEVDLRSLFLDSVGPPQGTLTAVFLEAAQERRSKFDRLLRVAEYEDAYRKLAALESALDEEQHQAEIAIAGLEPLAQARITKESQREEVRDRIFALVKELQRHVAERAACAREIEDLGRAEQAWQAARAALDLAAERLRTANAILERTEAERQRALAAANTCARTRASHDRYVEVTEKLLLLEADQKRRDELVDLRHAAERALQSATDRVGRLDDEIERAEQAASEAAELRRKIPEQEAAERRLQLARDAKAEFDQIRKRLPTLEDQLKRAQRRVELSEKAVADALALHSIADELPARRLGNDHAAARLAEANRAEGEVRALRQSIAQTQRRVEAGQKRAAELDRDIAALAALEADVAELASVEAAHREVSDGRAAASAQLGHSKATREQVGGGLCPFLHEACRNLRPGVTLETYFDGEIERWQIEVERLNHRLQTLERKLSVARDARDRIAALPRLRAERSRLEQDLADDLGRLDDDREKLRAAARLASERTEVERTALAAQRLLEEAQRAAQEVSRLSELRSGVAEARRDQQTLEQEQREARARIEALTPAVADLAAAVTALNALNSPRERASNLDREATKLGPLRARRQEAIAEQERAAARLASADQALVPFQDLDRRLEELRGSRDRCRSDHDEFVAASPLAATLTDRETALASAEASAAEARREAERCREVADSAAASYDQDAQKQARQRLGELDHAIGVTQGRITEEEKKQEDLEREIEDARRIELELEEHRRKLERIDDERQLADALRKSIRAAGPEITRQLLARISRMATRINAEILNQAGIELEWTTSYEIVTRRGGETRGFAQLSGGEQMAAALAVRLAILRDLSNIRIAFLDEPTAHLDQERRANLGDQVQRLQGFDQLVVISHDDTFDGLFGHVIRIGRENGRSRVLDQS